MPRPRKPANPFRYFHSSPKVIRLVVLMYVRDYLWLAYKNLNKQIVTHTKGALAS